ncbi:hypothetical protein BG015_011448 [Linnemannia schmuckeri]|uniref:Uncharacterized protein n=1 Tax=Linnemannia schmuckeri TaxID=64567 RepID=A0A9P5RV31_9FUNG|nr:hypothetical protein BG015_011448 [Linnemannia schmuckeri]
MAVTTRNRGVPPKPAVAAASPKKAATATKKSQKKAESEEDQDNEDEEEQNNQDQEESKKDADSDDEPTFKIHTPKAGAAAAPRITPAVLPTMKYEDDSDEEGDSDDEAPEAESLSSAKAKVQSAQDKEKSFLSKVQAEQKAKRIEREQKLKEQKDQSKAKKKATSTPTPAPALVSESTTSTTKPASELPALLPMDMLEEVAQMDDQEKSTKTTNDKKRKHMRLEDFALMELEAELKAEALKRKRIEKKQKNVGPVTVKVLDKSHLAQGHAIPQTVVDFRQQHFYGSKIARKDAILNMSQKSQGAARKFNRK